MRTAIGRKYLLDKDGYLRFDTSEGGYGSRGRPFLKLLREIDPRVELPFSWNRCAKKTMWERCVTEHPVNSTEIVVEESETRRLQEDQIADYAFAGKPGKLFMPRTLGLDCEYFEAVETGPHFAMTTMRLP